MSHTNAYYKNKKSFDSGHAFCTKSSGEHVPFKKWIGSLQYSSKKIAYILRIKDRRHFRVQAGAYSNKALAEQKVKEFATKWKLGATIKTEDGMYKIQLGFFSS